MQRRTFLKGIIASGAATFLGSAAYAYKSSKLEVSYERLVLSKLNCSLRVVAISDIHTPCYYAYSLDLVGIINAIQPDILILAGDIIDKKGNEKLVDIFKTVRTRFVKIATLGNWEYLGNLDLQKLKTEYNNAGVSLLVNDIIEVKGLMVIGLDDFILGAPDYNILSHSSNSKYPLLVISHCPESFDFITSFSDSALITLSGHTHGGQIAPFDIVLHTPEGSGSYVQGWYHKGKHSMYVNRGIGTSPGLPLRIGARPELLVLDLVGKRA